jgi:hypothetical protein
MAALLLEKLIFFFFLWTEQLNFCRTPSVENYRQNRAAVLFYLTGPSRRSEPLPEHCNHICLVNKVAVWLAKTSCPKHRVYIKFPRQWWRYWSLHLFCDIFHHKFHFIKNICGRQVSPSLCLRFKVKRKRYSNPQTGLYGLEGSGRLRLPDF